MATAKPKRRTTKADKPAKAMIATGEMSTTGRQRPTDVPALLRSYTAWTHHCVAFNAQSVADSTLRLFAVFGRGTSEKMRFPHRAANRETRTRLAKRYNLPPDADYEEVYEHPAISILDRPNPYLKRGDLLRLVEQHLSLAGDFYCWRIDGPLGVPQQLWPMPPQFMRIVTDGSDLVSAYLWYRDAAHQMAFAPEEIVRITRVSPADPYGYGFGNAASEIDAIWLGQNIDAYQVGTMKNDARPDIAVILKDGTPQTDVDRVRNEWMRLYGSARSNSQKVAFLTGATDIKPLSFTPKDVSYMQGDEKVMRRIAAAFGVPISFLTTDDVNRANAEAGLYQYAKFTLAPKLCAIEEALTEHIARRFDERLYFAFDDVVPKDETRDATINVQYVSAGIKTINEVRSDLSLPPVEWGDEGPYRPDPFALGSPSPTGKDSEDADEADDAAKSARLAPKPVCTHRKAADFPEDSPMIRRWENAIRRGFRRFRQLVLGESGKAAPGDPKAEADRILSDLAAAGAKAKDAMAGAVAGEVDAAAEEGSKVARGKLRRMNINLDESTFDIMNPEVSAFLDRYRIRLADEITKTTERRIRGAVQTGLENGDSVPGIRDRIAAVFDEADAVRANLIARTEASRAVHAGEREAYRQTGMVVGVRWSLSDDACEFCRALAAETPQVSINDSFRRAGDVLTAGDATMLLDYSDIDGPPLHPNCRCTLVPILE